MIDDSDILHESQDGYGRYFVRMPDGDTAEMAYTVLAPGIREFNHTYVPKSYRGSGVAALLMARAIADARAEGFKILPTCTYVAAQFRRHPDWSDLRSPGTGGVACAITPRKAGP